MPLSVKPALVLVGDWMPNRAMPSVSVALSWPPGWLKVSAAAVSVSAMTVGVPSAGAVLDRVETLSLTAAAWALAGEALSRATT